MRTIVIGLAFVLLWYALQAALVSHWFGWLAALAWLIVLFLSARVDFHLRERIGRAWRRARTYLALRSDPALRDQALAEIEAVVREALELEAALIAPLAAGR